MTFWKVKRALELLLVGSCIHVLVGLQCVQSVSWRTIRETRTHMGVEEERVRPPGEGFGTNIQVIVAGREGDVAIVLGHEVFLVFSMFTLNLLHPKVTSYDCFFWVNLDITFGAGKSPLACGETAVVTDLTPEVGGVWTEIG